MNILYFFTTRLSTYNLLPTRKKISDFTAQFSECIARLFPRVFKPFSDGPSGVPRILSRLLRTFLDILCGFPAALLDIPVHALKCLPGFLRNFLQTPADLCGSFSKIIFRPDRGGQPKNHNDGNYDNSHIHFLTYLTLKEAPSAVAILSHCLMSIPCCSTTVIRVWIPAFTAFLVKSRTAR